MKLPKRKKFKWYYNRAWKEFSKWIRNRDQGKCISCGIMKDPKEMQAGHFHHGWLDFDERNVNCQCVRCNKFLHGNGSEYAISLVRKHGKNILFALDEAKRDQKKLFVEIGARYRIEDLEDIYELYKSGNEQEDYRLCSDHHYGIGGTYCAVDDGKGTGC